MMRNWALRAFACLLLLSTPIATATATAEGATAFLRTLADDALAVLVNDSLGESERVDQLGALFDDGFDLTTISRFALGRYWHSATPEQRQEYQSVFRNFIVKSYAKRFSAFEGEELHIRSTRVETDGDAIIMSQIVRQQGAPTRVAWRVRRDGDEYKVVDVIVEGVSMLITHRDEFASVIRNSGGKVDGLISKLQERLQALN